MNPNMTHVKRNVLGLTPFDETYEFIVPLISTYRSIYREAKTHAVDVTARVKEIDGFVRGLFIFVVDKNKEDEVFKRL